MSAAIKIAGGLIGAQVVMAAAFGLAMPAHAAIETTTVDGVDYPVCNVEDCSDQPGQTGVWRNDGRAWLIVGESTYPVVP